MKKGFTCLIIFCLGFSLAAQQTTVANLTIKLGGLKTERLYYAFAAGDEVQLTLSVSGQKALKEVEIYKYPDHSLFMDYETLASETKLSIPEKGIYVVRLQNASMGKRVCSVNLSRIPKHDSLRGFNTQVYWKTLYDTFHYSVKESQLVKSEYTAVSVQEPQTFFINSGSNSLFKGGSSRVTVPLKLPPNTVEWHYIFAADRDLEKMAKTTKSFGLLSELTRLVDATGALDFAVSSITQPPGGDVCDIYLLDGENVGKFESKVAYTYWREASRENLSSGSVKVKGHNSGNLYLGIKNPDATQGIQASIEVVAIVYEEVWEMRDVPKFIATPKKVPYLK